MDVSGIRFYQKEHSIYDYVILINSQSSYCSGKPTLIRITNNKDVEVIKSDNIDGETIIRRFMSELFYPNNFKYKEVTFKELE